MIEWAFFLAGLFTGISSVYIARLIWGDGLISEEDARIRSVGCVTRAYLSLGDAYTSGDMFNQALEEIERSSRNE